MSSGLHRGRLWWGAFAASSLAAIWSTASLARVATGAQAPAADGSDPCRISAPGRVVAVGDVHGAYDRYVEILREAGLIDRNRRWTGGNTVFIQLGDVLHRGPDSRRVLDLLRTLEGEAARVGGHVRLLLGNHEVMRMGHDFRYVSREEYDAFRTRDSEDLRERLFQHLATQNAAQARARGAAFDQAAFRAQFLESTPLGSVEMQIAFGETGDYGRWLRQQAIVARVGDTAFIHAGLRREDAAVGCAGLNALVRRDVGRVMVSDPKRDESPLWNEHGPLWYRGLAGVAPEATGDDLAAVLKSLEVSRLVIAHTVVEPGRIRPRFDGRVIPIDTGMLGGEFYTGGKAAALEISGDTITAIYVGARERVDVRR
jgi:hypothetical protein